MKTRTVLIIAGLGLLLIGVFLIYKKSTQGSLIGNTQGGTVVNQQGDLAGGGQLAAGIGSGLGAFLSGLGSFFQGYNSDKDDKPANE